MTDLIVIEKINAVELFSGGDDLDKLLSKIEKDVTSVVPDLSTAKGRKAIASNAARIPSTKTALDNLGIEIVSDWKEKSKKVDKERKKMKDFLDALKAKVRKPLTDWEDAEKARVEKRESNVQTIIDAGVNALNGWMDTPIENMNLSLSGIESITQGGIWEEFAGYAEKEQIKAVSRIKEAIEKRKTYDNEQNELENLRAESEQREKEQREEQLRREGEEKAKLAAENERLAAVDAKDLTERKAKEAVENAERKAEEAAQAERDRIEQEILNEELATKKRETDTAHRKIVNNTIKTALVKTSGLTEDQAKLMITAIAKLQVPYVKINY